MCEVLLDRVFLIIISIPIAIALPIFSIYFFDAVEFLLFNFRLEL